MLKRVFAILAIQLTVCCAASAGNAMEKLVVMISGGFSLAYNQVLPEFERSTGTTVTTLSGASQGTGPKTIKSQLEQGAEVDVVILSKAGLNELVAAGLIAKGSELELADVPLGAAVRQGNAKPDISNVDAFKKAVLSAHLLVMGASTSGIFMKDEVFPRLAIAHKISVKLVPRGSDASGMVAAGEADLVLGPISELVHQPGIDVVGRLPDDVQLIQPFAAAIVAKAHNAERAKRLIEFLGSDRSTAAIKDSGMTPAGNRK